MSGHSHWATIQRKKGAEDSKRGKLFTRLGRDITMAARDGGNPDANPRLRLTIDKARSASMPKENIQRAIDRGTGSGGDGIIMEEITYEGYGPHGVAMLIDVLTDNKNRALSSVRQVFNKANGTMGQENSVAWQFDRKGYIEVDATGVDADDLFMVAADAGADDVVTSDDVIEVYTPRESLGAVEKALTESKYKVNDSKLTWVAKTETEVEKAQALQVMKMIDTLEELDDVQGVASALMVTDEIAEAYATA